MPHRVLRISFLILTFACSIATAQVAITSGAIRGVVSDNSGALVANVSVTLISRLSGSGVSRTSNSVGIFVFPSQPVGLYALEITASGFRKEIVSPGRYHSVW